MNVPEIIDGMHEVTVDGVRQDVTPRMESITYEITVDTDESGHRLELMHANVKKFGTVFNTAAPGTALSGVLRRNSASQELHSPTT